MNFKKIVFSLSVVVALCCVLNVRADKDSALAANNTAHGDKTACEGAASTSQGLRIQSKTYRDNTSEYYYDYVRDYISQPERDVIEGYLNTSYSLWSSGNTKHQLAWDFEGAADLAMNLSDMYKLQQNWDDCERYAKIAIDNTGMCDAGYFHAIDIFQNQAEPFYGDSISYVDMAIALFPQ